MTDPLSKITQTLTIIADTQSKTDFMGRIAPDHLSAPTRIAFVNAHAANLCHRNPAFLGDILACEYVLRDGSGMKILYRFMGREAGLNLNGTDFIPELLDLYNGRSVALLGTSEPYLANAAAIIEDKGADVTLKIDGFQDQALYLDKVRKARPALIILAMGMPKQESVAAHLAAHLDYPCLIVCGGAILDFMGGKVVRAPRLFRQFGMEWLYRLMLEPKRLFGRYVLGNVIFLWRALCASFRAKKG